MSEEFEGMLNLEGNSGTGSNIDLENDSNSISEELLLRKVAASGGEEKYDENLDLC